MTVEDQCGSAICWTTSDEGSDLGPMFIAFVGSRSSGQRRFRNSRVQVESSAISARVSRPIGRAPTRGRGLRLSHAGHALTLGITTTLRDFLALQ